ncbi:hypothetical protein Ae201684P_004972 [Aphanomyces euteiches]|nr:hypothetical protein Ae201684P_004972 [Aphanomyces euteiches]
MTGVTRWSLFACLFGLSCANLQDKCSAFAPRNDAFVDRVDKMAPQCLNFVDPHLADTMITHELDVDGQKPLSLLVFANTTEMLHDTSLVLASTFFGSHESDRLVRLDLHECRRVRDVACSSSKTSREQHLISLLDVFLLPLSGKIAHHDRWLDTLPTVFVFLFQTDQPPASRDSWRDFMEQQWPYTGVEFTPRALIGRIRDAVFINSTVDHSRCDFPPDQFSLQLPPYAMEAMVTAALAVVTVGVVAYLARKDDEPEVQFLPKKEHKQQPKQSVTVTMTQERHVVETKSTTIEEIADEQILEESVLRTKKSKKQRRRSTQSSQESESQESQEAEPKQSTTQLADEETPDESLETTVEATVAAEGTIQEVTDEPKQPTSRTAARGKGKARRQPKAEVLPPTRHSTRLEAKKSTKKTQ